jgi:phosphoglycolate phosphatase
MEAETEVQDLICDTILIDFDGPLYVLFPAEMATRAAAALSEVVSEYGLEPSSLGADPADFFDIWRSAVRELRGIGRERFAQAADSAIANVERYAADVGTIDARRVDLLKQLRLQCRALGVVTNNRTDVVRMLINRMGCDELVDYVAGRTKPQIESLKPAPTLLNEAMAALRSRRERSVFIGDSPTDTQAARAARIAYLDFTAIGLGSPNGIHLGMTPAAIVTALNTALGV